MGRTLPLVPRPAPSSLAAVLLSLPLGLSRRDSLSLFLSLPHAAARRETV